MILFDGGMGTMLQKFGLEAGSCPDYYNISHPDVVQQIHRAYMKAGSQFITTNTFGSSPLKLADYDLSDKVEEIAAAAVRNVRAACGDKVKVAGDMGPPESSSNPSAICPLTKPAKIITGWPKRWPRQEQTASSLKPSSISRK